MSFVIPSVFTAVDQVSKVTAKMGKSVMAFANISEASLARVDRKFRKIHTSALKISKTAAVIGFVIAAPLFVAARAASEFEASMSNVATLLDTNVENMQFMGAEVLKLSTRLPKPIEELTASLFDIRSAGIPANRAMATLDASAKLATAGLSTTEEATNILTSAINAFASEGLSATKIADILFKTTKFGKTTIAGISQAFGSTAPIIQSAGVTLADFSAATSALTTLGTPAAQAQTQIRAAISKLLKPTKEMEKLFSKIGVKTGTELIKKFGGMEGSFQALKKAGEATNITMAKAFGSVEALGAVTSLTGATNAIYTSTLKDMTTGTEALTEAFEKQKATNKAQMQIMKNSIDAVTISIGNALLPMINRLIKKVQPMVEEFITWSRANKDTVKTIVKVAVGVVAFAFAVSAAALVVSILSKAVLVSTSIYRVYKGVVIGLQAAQLALNAAMLANPLGLLIALIALIILAIVALVKFVISAIENFDTWGEAILAMLGPLGMVIGLIVKFGKNWDIIADKFKTEGIMAGIKQIGKTILDFMLAPLEMVLKAASFLPDFLGGGKASKALENLQQFRVGLGTAQPVLAPTVEEPAPIVDNATEQQGALAEALKLVQESNVNINILDKGNNVGATDSDSNTVTINTTSTLVAG